VNLIKRVLSSRLGIVLYAINFSILMLCVTRLRGLTTDEIDAHPLPPLFFFLTLINYLVGRPMTELFTYLGVQPSNLRDAAIFAVVSLQWLVVGFCIETIVKKIRA
jgi:hypothetical protein